MTFIILIFLKWHFTYFHKKMKHLICVLFLNVLLKRKFNESNMLLLCFFKTCQLSLIYKWNLNNIRFKIYVEIIYYRHLWMAHETNSHAQHPLHWCRALQFSHTTSLDWKLSNRKKKIFDINFQKNSKKKKSWTGNN